MSQHENFYIYSVRCHRFIHCGKFLSPGSAGNQNKDWKLYTDISAVFSPFRSSKVADKIFRNIPASKLIYGSDFPNPSKGRKEFFLRPFLRFKKANLFNRYYRISAKWLKKYYSQDDVTGVMTNFHQILENLGRGKII